MRSVIFAAFTVLTLALTGCLSPDTIKPVPMPADAIVVGFGQPATLMFPPYKAGTIFFTDDQTGKLVWATTIPNLTEPRQAFEPASLPPGFRADHNYRMYFSANLAPAYTQFQ